MCWEFIHIIASNISQIKIKLVNQWTARFNMERKPEKCWCLLRNFCFRLFYHKKNPGLFQDFSKIATFQDFFQIPGLSRTFQDWWEPQNKNYFSDYWKFWKESKHLVITKLELYITKVHRTQKINSSNLNSWRLHYYKKIL